MNRLLPCLLLVAGVLSPSVSADERILSFDSDITISADATMTVAETIRVRAEGNNIRRGIYRDFPTDYTDAYGNAYVVEFEVLGVSRDGAPERWRTTRQANGVRVYVGSSSALINREYPTTSVARMAARRRSIEILPAGKLSGDWSGNLWGL